MHGLGWFWPRQVRIDSTFELFVAKSSTNFYTLCCDNNYFVYRLIEFDDNCVKMPPKKLKESLVFVVNIGVVRDGTQSNATLLDKAKFILKHVIQKKIYMRQKDEVGVILMGSDSTTSDSITGMNNIQELDNIQVGNWDLIQTIDKLQTTNQNSTWMEAIYAAVEYIKHECVDKSDRKIMLLSDFNEDENIVSRFDADEITETLSSENILLIAIGVRPLENADKDSYTASEVLLMDVLEKNNGQYRTFEHAISEVRFYRQPSTRPSPWHCDMQLGDFRMPIIGINKAPKESNLPKMRLLAKTTEADSTEKQVPIENVTQVIDKDRNIQTKEDIIRGYIYGGKPISVSTDLQKNMTPKINEKCYKIHGFTARKNVPMEYWLSDGTYVIVPANECVSPQFYSLVQAMVDKDVVAIVEKVYRKNSDNNMVALFPSVDALNEPWCLIEIGLPFERDYGAIAQRPLNFLMKQLSKEQSDAVDNLLESLELSEAVDENSAAEGDRYLPESMPDPGAQHMWDILSARALHPDQPLPPIAEEVKNLLEQPASVTEKCKSTTERIKNLFALEKIISSKSKRRRKLNGEEEENMILNREEQEDAVQLNKEQNTGIHDKGVSKNVASLPDDNNDMSDFDFDEIADI